MVFGTNITHAWTSDLLIVSVCVRWGGGGERERKLVVYHKKCERVFFFFFSPTYFVSCNGPYAPKKKWHKKEHITIIIIINQNVIAKYLLHDIMQNVT